MEPISISIVKCSQRLFLIHILKYFFDLSSIICFLYKPVAFWNNFLSSIISWLIKNPNISSTNYIIYFYNFQQLIATYFSVLDCIFDYLKGWINYLFFQHTSQVSDYIANGSATNWSWRNKSFIIKNFVVKKYFSIKVLHRYTYYKKFIKIASHFIS